MAKPATGPFGAWLRQWRKANRHTLATFAAEAKLTKSYVWELERAKDFNFNPSLATLMAISKATNTAFTRVALIAAQQRMEAGRG